jgi:hypothetical protein
MVLGYSYILLAIGFLLNYFTYFLLWILEPIPDQFILYFIKFTDIDTFSLELPDINLEITSLEESVYLLIALLSFSSMIQLVISIYLLVNKIVNPKRTLFMLFGGLTGCLFFGFTTFMPFML